MMQLFFESFTSGGLAIWSVGSFPSEAGFTFGPMQKKKIQNSHQAFGRCDDWPTGGKLLAQFTLRGGRHSGSSTTRCHHSARFVTLVGVNVVLTGFTSTHCGVLIKSL